MIYIMPERSLDFTGVAAESVNDLITLHKGKELQSEAERLAMSISNCVGSRITFTSRYFKERFEHRFGEFFEKRGINLSHPKSGYKPARYDELYRSRK